MSDFDQLWTSGLWRKMGRVEAERRFNEQIKTPMDRQAIQAARDAYNAYCIANRRWYMPMLGSVWFGKRKGWRDWIPDDATGRRSTPLFDPLPKIHEHLCEFCEVDHLWTCADPEECMLSKDLACPAFHERIEAKARARMAR